jgi:sec-independent protein translocase protein TatB
MNFFGVGPAELIVILVVALVFVGPERLPKLAADLARTIREIRKYTGSLAAEFNEVIQKFEKDTQGEKSTWKEIETGITGAAKSVTDAVRDVRAEVQGAKNDAATAPPASNGATATDAVASGPATWAEIPSVPPEAQPGTPAVAANGVHVTNGAVPPEPAPLPAEEAR